MFSFSNSNKKEATNQKEVVDLEIQTMKDDLENSEGNKHLSLEIDKKERPALIQKKAPETIANPFIPTGTQNQQKKSNLMVEKNVEKPISSNKNPASLPNLEKVLASYDNSRSSLPMKEPAFKKIADSSLSMDKKSSFPMKSVSSKKNNPILGSESHIESQKKINKILLMTALSLLVITLITGSYYYFGVIKRSEDQEPSNQNTNSIRTNSSFSEPRTELSATNTTEFKNSKALTVENDDLKASIKKLIDQSKTDSSNSSNNWETGTGIILEPKDSSGTKIQPVALANSLSLELSEIQQLISDSWIFVTKNESGTFKLSLVLKTNDGLATAESFKSIEKDLPNRLQGLFIDEILELPTISEAQFKESSLDKQRRYFNLKSNDDSQSIDWGVINSDDKSYLVIATSKESMEKTLTSIENNK